MSARPGKSGRTSVPLGFGNITACIGDHIAHFYRGTNQMLSVLGPYVAEGIRRGEKSVVISSPDVAEKLYEWLGSEGLDIPEARKSKQLICHSGEPTSNGMRTFVDRMLEDASSAGYKFIRWAGDGGWALAGKTTINEMLSWEALYDKISVNWPILALCQFDLAQFRGDAVMEALRSHPLCIIGQHLVPNPFHISPEALLQELKKRE
ncbi:MAG: MEDS domain-containing protein [bacterium]